MPITQVTVIFEGPAMDAGVSVTDLNETLKRLQTAVRLMASHLAGVRAAGASAGMVAAAELPASDGGFPGVFQSQPCVAGCSVRRGKLRSASAGCHSGTG